MELLIVSMFLDLHVTTAPGPVLNLASSTKFFSIMLTWDPPDEPNGVIIRYEVTYRISDINIQTVNTGLNTAFIITSL